MMTAKPPRCPSSAGAAAPGPGTRRAATRIAIVLSISLAACAPQPAEKTAELTLRILDDATGSPTPARVELLDGAGRGHVADDALAIVIRDEGPASRAAIDTQLRLSRAFTHPQTGTDQFYSTGSSTLSLAPGEYRLRVWKGPEYRSIDTPLTVTADEDARHELRLIRWIDMPKRGWYSADDHLHIPRPTAESNAGVHQWMAAEDIHVANLLQMGSWRAFDSAPQYAHGAAGRHAAGRHVLLSGQENPRTHFLGHTIILGARSPIHFPDAYLDFRRHFEEGHRQGGLNGFAHFGRYGGAQLGLGLVLPHGLLDFLEVLQLGRGQYDVWYKILNTGFRLAPTAGTDYPWSASPPGGDRFYARVGGKFTIDKWLRSVRDGRTFVTNGPMLSFRVDGRQAMGATLELARPGTVDVLARVEFDRDRDFVTDLELVENGVVVRTFPSLGVGINRIVSRFRHEVRRSGWLAVRASGLKVGESVTFQALAHSAPLYVSVADGSARGQSEEARRLAHSWIVLLDDLEERLADENIEHLAGLPFSGAVPAEYIRQSRPALLHAIHEAREQFRERAR